MRNFTISVLSLCSLALSQVSAEDNTQNISQRLEAAKADSKRFKTALLRAQRASREQVEKLSAELKAAQAERENLESQILKIKDEATSRYKSYSQEIQNIENKSTRLNAELESARKASLKQVDKLTTELTAARQLAGQLQDDLIKARKGNTTQVESLENELKDAHQKLQKVRNDLAEAKSVNAKQLKNFTAWLYNAKSQAEELKTQLSVEKAKYDEMIYAYEQKLKNNQNGSKDLQLKLASIEKRHQEELLDLNEQIFISQSEHRQIRENLMQERYERQQMDQYKPLCDDRPDPCLFCWRPHICESTTWVRGELLYWTAEASDLDFVMPNYPIPTTTATGLRGKVERADFGWDPGFRVEIGHRFKPDLWDLAFTYTYENISGAKDIPDQGINGQVLMPTQTNSTNQVAATSKSTVDLRYNVFDLMLGRTFLPTKQVFIRPSMGLTGAWINRDFDVKYIGFSNLPNQSHDHYSSDFSGGGMRLGIDFDWYLGKGFSIFGKSSIAALLGYYSNFTKADTDNAGTNLGAVDVENSNYNDNRIATHIQMQLGPSYGIMWDDWGLNVFAGYEVNAWFNVAETRSADLSATTSSAGSRRTIVNDSVLGLHGFVGKIQFNF